MPRWPWINRRIRPDLRGGGVAPHQLAQERALVPRGIRHRKRADKAKAPVDRQVALGAEHRDGKDALGRGPLARSAGLHRPAGIHILLGRLGGIIGPDLSGRLAGLDLLLLGRRIPLPGARP